MAKIEPKVGDYVLLKGDNGWRSADMVTLGALARHPVEKIHTPYSVNTVVKLLPDAGCYIVGSFSSDGYVLVRGSEVKQVSLDQAHDQLARVLPFQPDIGDLVKTSESVGWEKVIKNGLVNNQFQTDRGLCNIVNCTQVKRAVAIGTNVVDPENSLRYVVWGTPTGRDNIYTLRRGRTGQLNAYRTISISEIDQFRQTFITPIEINGVKLQSGALIRNMNGGWCSVEEVQKDCILVRGLISGVDHRMQPLNIVEAHRPLRMGDKIQAGKDNKQLEFEVVGINPNSPDCYYELESKGGSRWSLNLNDIRQGRFTVRLKLGATLPTEQAGRELFGARTPDVCIDQAHDPTGVSVGRAVANCYYDWKDTEITVGGNNCKAVDLIVGGRKDDTGKDPWELAPWDAFRAIVKIMQFGAKNYGERNWEQGMKWGRLFAAAQRHLTAWWERADEGKGPGKDKDTGQSHLWHAGCCVLFLIAYELRGVGQDDRPGKTEPCPPPWEAKDTGGPLRMKTDGKLVLECAGYLNGPEA